MGLEKRIRIYAGQYYDQETGLHYNYHRYYDPATGRYLTADPIGLAGGINLFAYVGGNPVNLVDPYGLEVFGINFGGSAFYGPGGGASTAILIESNGKTNRIGLVTTREVGGGEGAGLFVNGVYGPERSTVESYANTSLSVSGNIGFLTGSFSFGSQEPFYELGVSPIPGESVSITQTFGQVAFVFEYSFGAADTFWGELLYDLLHHDSQNSCN
jgi:RHS repeat-associated protein